MYKIGMIQKGTVTGVQPYGAFVSLDKDVQGLIHISECTHGFVKDLNELLQVGDEITVQIIDIDEYTKKISLSIRTLEKQVPYHEVPKKKKFKRKKAPKIGFSSIQQMMPTWVKEAQIDESNREN